MMRLGVVDCMELDRVRFVLTLTVSMHPAGNVKVVEHFQALQPMLARYEDIVATEAPDLTELQIDYGDGRWLFRRVWKPVPDVIAIEGKLAQADLDRLREAMKRAHSGPWATGGIIPPGSFGLVGEFGPEGAWRPGIAPDGTALGLFDCGACGKNIFREDTADCEQCERRHNVKRMVMAMDEPRPTVLGWLRGWLPWL